MTPLLVILVFGITEIGRALYQENTLAKAVESGARYLSRAYGVLDPASCASVEDPVNGISWSTSVAHATNVVVYGNEDGNGGPRLPGLDASGAVTFGVRGPETITVDVGGTSQTIDACVITAATAAQFNALFGDSIVPLLHLGPITLNANSEARWIGE